MLKEVMHIGLTVNDLDKSIEFYRDVLGLDFIGELVMHGNETDILFGKHNASCKVAYLNGNDNIMCPPIELIEFVNKSKEYNRSNLFLPSISEICFRVDNLDAEYKRLVALGVQFLSEPQLFDFTSYGFSKSKAVYFYDINGIILELMETID